MAGAVSLKGKLSPLQQLWYIITERRLSDYSATNGERGRDERDHLLRRTDEGNHLDDLINNPIIILTRTVILLQLFTRIPIKNALMKFINCGIIPVTSCIAGKLTLQEINWANLNGCSSIHPSIQPSLQFLIGHTTWQTKSLPRFHCRFNNIKLTFSWRNSMVEPFQPKIIDVSNCVLVLNN